VELSPQGQRVLGCLVEKALTTPGQYPLSDNALRTACNQSTGRDPVVEYDDADVQSGIADLRDHRLVRSEHTRGARVVKTAHRLEEVLGLTVPEQAVLALLLLRGPQTPGELRSRAQRMHAFAEVEEVEEVLAALAGRAGQPLAALLPREPGRREARWTQLLGPVADGDGPGAATSGTTGRHRPFHDAVVAGDLDTAVAQLTEDVVFRSPAVHAPYEGREVTGMVLRAVAQVFEDFHYVDVLDAGDRAGLVFAARVGDREIQGWDYLRFDDQGYIAELTVMIRPLTGLQAVVEAMRQALGDMA
jgi:uncharacterized protein YceH (UPF0502 family)